MSIKDNIRDPDGFGAYLDRTYNRMDRPQEINESVTAYRREPKPIATGYEILFNDPPQPKSFEDQVAEEVLKRLP